MSEGPVVLGQVPSYGPALAAVATAASVAGRPGLRQLGRALVRWRVGWHWYAVVFVAPLAISGIGRLLHAQLTGQPARWPLQEPAELLVVPLLLVEVVAMAILFTWVFNHTRGSIVLAILLHATDNLAGPQLPRPDEGLFTPFLLVTGLKWALGLLVLAADPHFRRRGAPTTASAATAAPRQGLA